jgi:hypothetical protein
VNVPFERPLLLVSQRYVIFNEVSLTQRVLHDQQWWEVEVASRSSCCFRNRLANGTFSVREFSNCPFGLVWANLPNHPR